MAICTKIQMIRKEYENIISSLYSGEIIHIDKDLLEQLLFDYVEDEKNDKKYKVPVWTGPFLRHIDLSEIKFVNVSFAKTGLDFSNTNAKFDFLCSYEARNNYRYPIISEYNFSNVDLSNSNILILSEVQYCDLSNTSIRLTQKMIDDCSIKFKNTNLSYNDFSNLNLNGITYLASFKRKDKFVVNTKDCIFDEYCDFTNTGINIDINSTMLNCYVGYYTTKELNIKFRKMLNSGKFNGCFVNGHFINPLNDRKIYSDDFITEILTPKGETKESKPKGYYVVPYTDYRVIKNMDYSYSSVSDFKKAESFINCNFTNSYSFHLEQFHIEFKYYTFRNCKFCGKNFANLEVNGVDLFSRVEDSVFDDSCDFSNTRIKINIDSESMPEDTNDYSLEKPIDIFKRMLNNGYLVGCYVNGHYIKPLDEKEEEYSDEYIEEILKPNPYQYKKRYNKKEFN